METIKINKLSIEYNMDKDLLRLLAEADENKKEDVKINLD